MDSVPEILPPFLSRNDERRQILWPETVLPAKIGTGGGPRKYISRGERSYRLERTISRSRSRRPPHLEIDELRRRRRRQGEARNKREDRGQKPAERRSILPLVVVLDLQRTPERIEFEEDRNQQGEP